MELEAIKKIIKEQIDIDVSAITEETTFEDLQIDSLDMVELTCDLEERCDIKFGEPEGLETIGDLVNYIDGLK